MNDVDTIHVIPSGGPLGAELRGLDLSKQLPDAVFASIQAAWREHLVLLFRGQSLSDRKLIAFSRHFGELDLCPPNDLGRTHIEEMPEIVVISNVSEGGRKIGSLGSYESIWHTDMSYRDVPPRASLLHSLEVPPTGGDTQFSNMYLALKRMPAELRSAIEGVVLVHDSTYDSAGSLRKGMPEVTDPSQAPGARHPIIRVHPDTGREALYLGRRRNAYVIGLPVADSERLLDRVWAHAMLPEFVWTHRWQVGDLLIWDNRCTMHRRDAFNDASRRIMHRTQVTGEPVAAPKGWTETGRVAA